MAEFELNIYGKDDEILKTYASNRVRWGVFMQAVELQDGLDDMTNAEQFAAINQILKKVFPELTDAELEAADAEDAFNTFRQLVRKAAVIGSGESSKNA